HGCVRLENPRELALYLLSGRSGWAEEDIDRVIAAGQTERVPLPRSLPVYLLYWTAFVDAEGAVEFRDDVYARDQRLTTALATRDAGERGRAVPRRIKPRPIVVTAIERSLIESLTIREIH